MRKEDVVSPSHALATSPRHASACRLVLAVALILVMNFRPVGKPVRRSILLATLRHYIEVAVDSHKLFTAAAECAVRVEDLAFRVLVEHAVSGKRIGLRPNLLFAEVIDRPSRLHF